MFSSLPSCSKYPGPGTILPGLEAMVRRATRRVARSWSSVTEQTLAAVGDVVHCPVELLDDEWVGIGDVDQ
jgi:hypothetical protein